MVFISEKRRQPYFNLALTMTFWSLAAMLLMPLGKAMASTPPMLDQTDPAVCQGFTLPPPSPELDQILAAQQAISEAVFPAGGANYLYCDEGVWLLDQDLNETKEIHSDQDSPISGVTYGGDDFLVYPFMVDDVDITTLGLSPDELQWVQDHKYAASMVAGEIETALGATSFFGMYQEIDDGNGGMDYFIIPFEMDDSFDLIYSLWFFMPKPQGSPDPGLQQRQDCIAKAYVDFNKCVANAKIDYQTCSHSHLPGIIGGAVGCGLGARLGGTLGHKIGTFTGGVVGCALGALAVSLAKLNDCTNAFLGDLAKCKSDLAIDNAACAQQYKLYRIRHKL